MIYKPFEEKYRAVHWDSKNKEKYRDETHAVDQEFKAALAQHYLPGYDERVTNRVFDMAHEEGHAYGYNAIEHYYETFSDLVKFVK